MLLSNAPLSGAVPWNGRFTGSPAPHVIGVATVISFVESSIETICTAGFEPTTTQSGAIRPS